MTRDEPYQVHRQIPYSQAATRGRMREIILLRMIVVLLSIMVIWGITNEKWYQSAFAAPAAQSTPPVQTPVIVGSGGARLYDSPGGNVQRTLTPGTVVTAVGRSDDSLWVVVQTIDRLSGWMQASEAVVYGLQQLPVMLKSTELVTTSITETQPASALPTPIKPTDPSPTPAPTLLPIPQPTITLASNSSETGQVAIVFVSGAGLYDLPNGTQTAQLSIGMTLTALGRSADGSWVFVKMPSGVTGWVHIADMMIANSGSLPTLDSVTGSSVAASTVVSATNEQPIQAPNLAVEGSSAQKGTDTSSDPNSDPNSAPNKVIATVNQIGSRLNIRSGPGTSYLILGQAAPGDTFEVSARNDEATWIQIKTRKGENGLAWVSAEFVTLSHPILNIAASQTANQNTPASAATIGDIGCITNQIIKWDSGQTKWVCSDELTTLQAEVTALQSQIAGLQAEIDALKR